MRRILTTSIISFLFIMITMAQTGFRPGYVIKNNGDTLNGFIHYNTDAKYSKSCVFRRFDIAMIIEYKPGQIKAFGFEQGRYFESKRKGNRQTFMECILKGPVSVFIRPGKDHSPVFLETASTGFFELNRGANRLGSAGTFGDYNETIGYLLSQHGGTAGTVEKTSYTAGEIAARIRSGMDQSPEVTRAFVKTAPVSVWKDYSITNTRSTQIGLTGGYQLLTVSIPGSPISRYFNDAEYNTSFRPVFGFYLSQKLLKRSDILYLDVAGTYFQDTYYGYSSYEYFDDLFVNDIFIDITSIQVPLALKLRFGKGRVRPFVKVGGYRDFDLETSFKRYEDLLEGGTEVYTDVYAEYTPWREYGYLGALGMEWRIGTARIITLEAGFQQGKRELTASKTHIGTDRNTTLTTNCLSFQLRINL